MPEKLKEKDFVELEYTGKEINGRIFDTNVPSELKKINPGLKPKKLVICLGENMLLPAIDQFLINKIPGDYKLELKPEKAFGERKQELVKIMPMSVFSDSDRKPVPGMIFSFDNLIGRIMSVSGGRVRVDFNNPLAGKEIAYELHVLRKITEQDEKIKALMNAFFKREFDFKVDGKKLNINIPLELKQFIDIFKDKFKEILGLELVVEGVDEGLDEDVKKKI